MNHLRKVGVTLPIVQAPMAGISTPALAAAVSNAGGLGSIGVGATDAAGASAMIAEFRALSTRALNVNVFVHARPVADSAREAAWLKALGPQFSAFGAAPAALTSPYRSFLEDPDMLRVLLETAPSVVSFHFGLPPKHTISALKSKGVLLLATVTSTREAVLAEAAGIDILVAQGIEAGGHRGVFDPALPDDALSTLVLTRLLVEKMALPVIAAGGIMDGAGIRAALSVGASAVQLGTAFLCCPESATEPAQRTLLKGPAAYHTVLTSVVSGRPARALPSRLTALSNELGQITPPDYPITYAAQKALHTQAKAAGEFGFGAYWAGQGAPLIREEPAAKLVAALMHEASS